MNWSEKYLFEDVIIYQDGIYFKISYGENEKNTISINLNDKKNVLSVLNDKVWECLSKCDIPEEYLIIYKDKIIWKFVKINLKGSTIDKCKDYINPEKLTYKSLQNYLYFEHYRLFNQNIFQKFYEIFKKNNYKFVLEILKIKKLTEIKNETND